MRKDKIQESLDSGTSISDLAERYHVKYNAMYYFVRDNKLRVPGAKPIANPLDDRKDQIRGLMKRGETFPEIAKIVKTTPNKLRAFAREQHMRQSVIEELLAQGITEASIAQSMRMSSERLSTYMKKYELCSGEEPQSTITVKVPAKPTFLKQKLIDARGARGLTQAAAAELLGIPGSTFSHIEYGSARLNPEVLKRKRRQFIARLSGNLQSDLDPEEINIAIYLLGLSSHDISLKTAVSPSYVHDVMVGNKSRGSPQDAYNKSRDLIISLLQMLWREKYQEDKKEVTVEIKEQKQIPDPLAELQWLDKELADTASKKHALISQIEEKKEIHQHLQHEIKGARKDLTTSDFLKEVQEASKKSIKLKDEIEFLEAQLAGWERRENQLKRKRAQANTQSLQKEVKKFRKKLKQYNQSVEACMVEMQEGIEIVMNVAENILKHIDKGEQC